MYLIFQVLKLKIIIVYSVMRIFRVYGMNEILYIFILITVQFAYIHHMLYPYGKYIHLYLDFL